MKASFLASLAWVAFLASGPLAAKLPPPSDEAKAKAAEAAAKAAHGNKVAAYELCRSMDQVAAGYFAAAKKAGTEVAPPVATPPCTEPGPFVYAPPPAKPLEAAGAHSPAATATAPPSGNTPAAEMKAGTKP